MVANTKSTKKPAAKKATAKKPAAKKTVSAKTSTKKAPVKKTTAKKAAPKKTRAKKPAKMQSFRVYRDTPFTRVQISRQTIYWTLFLAVIMITQLWILNVQLEIADLTNALLQAQY